jgi:hypothetical protein
VFVIRLLYKPFALAFSIAAGVFARKSVDALWAMRASDDSERPHEPPATADRGAPLRTVVAGAALQAAVFAAVRAFFDRQGRRLFAHLTGFWPR